MPAAPRCGGVPGDTGERTGGRGLARATSSTTVAHATRSTTGTWEEPGPLAAGPSGLCWAGRSPPVGPRQGEPTLAGGPTAWERAGRHGPGGRGPAADLGAADDAEHDGHLGDAEPDGDMRWGDALGSAALDIDDGNSVLTPTAPRPHVALRVDYQDDTSSHRLLSS